MLYASKLYRELPSRQRVAVESSPDDIPNLVAEVLVRAVERRLRRDLSSDFRKKEADLTRVRGRVDHLRTERKQLLLQGRVSCSFDELSTDNLQNQYVKAALNSLVNVLSDKAISRRCRLAIASLERAGVSHEISTYIARRSENSILVPRTRNVEDHQMWAAAQLAFTMSIPSEHSGAFSLPAPDRDERLARRLFEAAVGGFYDAVLSPEKWRVITGKRSNWKIVNPTPLIYSILPSMKTDIVLEQPPTSGRDCPYRTIIDTKFTPILRAGQYGQPTLNSGYIYQIYAYLRSQESGDDPPSLDAVGMLLHPSVDGEVDEAVTIQGHRIRFSTVDLTADSKDIRNRLLELAIVKQV